MSCAAIVVKKHVAYKLEFIYLQTIKPPKYI